MISLSQTDSGTTETLLRFIQGGGVIGYIILALSVAALAFTVTLSLRLRPLVLAPTAVIDGLTKLVTTGKFAAAQAFARDAQNDCVAARLAATGLERRLRGPLGANEARGAMEEAGDGEAATLSRGIEPLAVIAAIAPLLGLLGTVQGMIGAFDEVAAMALGDARAKTEMAHQISIALITTFQGLVVALPCVVLHSYFRNRIEALTGRLGQQLEAIALALESPELPAAAKTPASPARPATAAAAAAAAAAPAQRAAP